MKTDMTKELYGQEMCDVLDKLRGGDLSGSLDSLVSAKDCYGCKGLREEQYHVVCEVNGFECSDRGIPKTRCPKPRTIKKLVQWNLSH